MRVKAEVQAGIEVIESDRQEIIGVRSAENLSLAGRQGTSNRSLQNIFLIVFSGLRILVFALLGWILTSVP